jgi:D-alanyl-D-alanine carboxypeptidase/D-alanyl-D-alanine-endopeptidase (penicillin-binding protein 4)
MAAEDPAGAERLLALDDPALYSAFALADALSRRGVAISGRPAARHRFANQDTLAPPGGVELARRTSPPLIELLRIIDKVSQNLHAELVLREVARVRRSIGSREAGLEESRQFLAEAGVEETGYRFEDGSGLSRLNLVTAHTVVRLLRHMYRSPHREAWLGLLPVGGEDGTLNNRFDGNPAARRIRAKTGTLSHVSALSGYADSPSRGRLAFSILVNNYNAPASEIRDVIDRIGLLLTE